MKNTATEEQEASPGWVAALEVLEADLRRRNAAERTRRAYRSDLRQLAVWATGRGMEPTDLDHRMLRRHAASLSEEGNGARTVARKLASARALFRALREHGMVEANPADLVSAPKRDQKLPRVLATEEV